MISKTSFILSEFYDKDLFTEEFLLCWYESPDLIYDFN